MVRFDFKGAERPALLQERVNYEVMGANEWRHAPSLEAMGRGSCATTSMRRGGELRTPAAPAKPSKATFVAQTINFKDRSDADWTRRARAMRNLQLHNAVAFVSEALKNPRIQRAVLREAGFQRQQDGSGSKPDAVRAAASGEYLALFDPAYGSGPATCMIPVPAGCCAPVSVSSSRSRATGREPGSKPAAVWCWCWRHQAADRQINTAPARPSTTRTSKMPQYP